LAWASKVAQAVCIGVTYSIDAEAVMKEFNNTLEVRTAVMPDCLRTAAISQRQKIPKTSGNALHVDLDTTSENRT
jgi:hypothetical protein